MTVLAWSYSWKHLPASSCYAFTSCLTLKTNGNKDTLDISKYTKLTSKRTEEVDIQASSGNRVWGTQNREYDADGDRTQ